MVPYPLLLPWLPHRAGSVHDSSQRSWIRLKHLVHRLRCGNQSNRHKVFGSGLRACLLGRYEQFYRIGNLRVTPKCGPPSTTQPRNHEIDRKFKSPAMGVKNHVVFIPKYRKKAIFGQIRNELNDVFRRLAWQKETVIEEVHLIHRIPIDTSGRPCQAMAGQLVLRRCIGCSRLHEEISKVLRGNIQGSSPIRVGRLA